MRCAYSSADKSTGLRNRGSWVQIPLGALSESSPFGNIFSSQGLSIRSNFSAADLLVLGKRWAGPAKSGNYKNLEVKRDSEEAHCEIFGGFILRKEEAAYKMPPEA